MVLDTEVTFPKVTLWRSGVHLQDRTSITAYLHLYIGRDRASVADSSVDFLPFEIGRAPKAKVADYPRSFTKREIFHARTSDNPRSGGAAELDTAFVSICNI